MSFHADLLEQADHLSRRESRRPKQASLRRAVSTAYYALFHLLNSESVAVIGGNLSPSKKAAVQRWFGHSEMKKVCHTFLRSPFSTPAPLLGFQPSQQLQVVALNFIRLQEARHKADYDLTIKWTRWSSQQQIRLAQEAFAAWNIVRGSEEANIFILSLLLWKNWEEKERRP